jgi:glyoxylase-like metal-dependent hydrolase (beta-lactamase superfamily II)
MAMAQVKVLVEGYTSGDTGGRSCSTVVLVRDGDLNLVADPGTLPCQEKLLSALAKEGLAPQDIGIVFITHSHMDHYRNIGMFPSARALDYWGWWQGDLWKKCGGRISKNLMMIKTPGHSYDGMTLLAETNEGIVAICGDVFWKERFPRKDKYASDEKALAESRRLVLRSADVVIPGHGKMFSVKKSS